jgi:hypothetical protein
VGEKGRGRDPSDGASSLSCHSHHPLVLPLPLRPKRITRSKATPPLRAAGTSKSRTKKGKAGIASIRLFRDPRPAEGYTLRWGWGAALYYRKEGGGTRLAVACAQRVVDFARDFEQARTRARVALAAFSGPPGFLLFATSSSPPSYLPLSASAHTHSQAQPSSSSAHLQAAHPHDDPHAAPTSYITHGSAPSCCARSRRGCWCGKEVGM